MEKQRHRPLRSGSAIALVAILLTVACTSGDGSPQRGATSATSSGATGTDASQAPLSRAQEFRALTEYVNNMIDCLEADGIKMRKAPDGLGFEPDPAYPQGEGAGQSFTECNEENGPPPEPRPLTAEEWSAAYPEAERQSRCLEQNGFPVPELPSRETWVQDMVTGSKDSYYAFSEISPDQIPSAQRACPAKDVVQILAEAETGG